jgi:hypothetical protein
MHFALARDNGKNYTGAVQFIQYCIDKMGPHNLHAIAIGNEPDLYYFQDQRPATYGPVSYAAGIETYINLLKANVTGLSEGRAFQIYDKSSETNQVTWNMYVHVLMRELWPHCSC